MPKAIADLAREAYAAFERGDIDWNLKHSHPDVEIVQPAEVPDSKTYRGHQGMRDAFADWPAQWDEFRVELLETIEMDDERVLSLSRHHMRARGLEMDTEVANVLTFRDGKLLRWEMFFGRDQALEAMGLSEQPPPSP